MFASVSEGKAPPRRGDVSGSGSGSAVNDTGKSRLTGLLWRRAGDSVLTVEVPPRFRF